MIDVDLVDVTGLDLIGLIDHDENSMFSQMTSKDHDDSSCATTRFDEQSRLCV